MGQRNWYIALSLEAAACLLLVTLLGWNSSEGGILASLAAFPFAQIGLGLRWLSLSGAVGNGLAIGLYVLLGLIPLIALGVIWRRRRLRRADALLAVLSALLFWVLYLMVNPGLLTAWLNLAAGGIVGRAVLGGAVYGVLAGWLVLRALEMARGTSAGRLLWALGWLLGLLAAAFVAAAFAGGAAGAQAAVVSLRNGNLGSEGTLGPSYVFLILGQGGGRPALRPGRHGGPPGPGAGAGAGAGPVFPGSCGGSGGAVPAVCPGPGRHRGGQPDLPAAPAGLRPLAAVTEHPGLLPAAVHGLCAGGAAALPADPGGQAAQGRQRPVCLRRSYGHQGTSG